MKQQHGALTLVVSSFVYWALEEVIQPTLIQSIGLNVAHAALVPHKMFDNGEGRATIAGSQGTMVRFDSNPWICPMRAHSAYFSGLQHSKLASSSTQLRELMTNPRPGSLSRTLLRDEKDFSRSLR